MHEMFLIQLLAYASARPRGRRGQGSYTLHSNNGPRACRFFRPAKVVALLPGAAPAIQPTPPSALHRSTKSLLPCPMAYPASPGSPPARFLPQAFQILRCSVRCHSCCSAQGTRPTLLTTRLPSLSETGTRKTTSSVSRAFA